MTATRALTVVAELDPARRADLDRALATIRADLVGKHGTNTVLRPDQLPDTHFTRLVIIDDAAGELAPVLAWEANHDGATIDYLTAVAREAVRADRTLDLDAVWGCCKDYPARGVRDTDGWVRWMRARAVRTEAFYCGYRGVPKRQVDNDRRVHAEIRAYLAAHRRDLEGLAPVEIQARIRDHLRTIPGLDVSRQGDGELAAAIRKVAGYAALGAVGLVALVAAPVAYPLLRHRERTDPAQTFDRPVHAPAELIAVEDQIIQNQLTHVVDIKPGAFRYWLLRGVLFGIDTLARVEYVDGHLGGITSIHFARWLILKDRRPRPARRRHRLVFFSNYDFSWESYLGEFIDRAAGGLTAVWSNTEGFPPARRLLRDGATDEERFKSWTRARQIETQVWWSGVRDASVDNVRDAIWIRRRIARPLSDAELPEFLRRL